MKWLAILALCGSGCATAGSSASKAAALPVCESNVIAVVRSPYWSYEDALLKLKAAHWITDASTVVQASNQPQMRNPSVTGRAAFGSAPAPMRDLRGEARILAALDVNGRVERTLMVRGSGNSDLDESVRRSIESAEFEPAAYNGCRVAAVLMIPIKYRADRRR